jgi:translation initiation factor IF-2
LTSESYNQTNPGESSKVAARTVQLRPIEIPVAVSVGDLADIIDVSPINLMKQLMRSGVMANINQVIDFDTAATVIPAFGFHATRHEDTSKTETTLEAEVEDDSLLQLRPPVVTILGHVDHGKTSLLDVIRTSKVAEKEAGGITQHIGAYQATYKDQQITFLDTPGHQAFTAMRARGAQVTDIVILIVAADDGIMPQTLEAIDHVKAAGVPIVVAINKIDLPDADPEKVKRQLAEQNLLLEEWGGEVVGVLVSAKTGEGVEDLLENILVVSEMSQLRANPEGHAKGIVVEARLDRSRGPVATVLVGSGTLRVGDHFAVGDIRGKVRAITNDAGRRIERALPSMPVEILGMSSLPAAGSRLVVAGSERETRAMIQSLEQAQGIVRHISLGEMSSRIRGGESQRLNLILKADVQGSVEALRDSLNQLSTDKLQVHIIRAASGTVTETDVSLAVASQAIIIGFNTTLEPGARQAVDNGKVEVRFYNVIYNLLEDVSNTLQGLAEPEYQEIVEGHLIVRAVFSMGRQNKVAGAYVTDGRAVRNGSARVLRKGGLIHDGTISSLRHFKDDVREMGVGFECGIGLVGFNDFEEEDILEIYRQERV